MVGRSYPKYKEVNRDQEPVKDIDDYESTSDEKSVRTRKDRRAERKAQKEMEQDEKLEWEREQLEKQRQRAIERSEMRDIKKETFRLEHPHYESAKKRSSKAVGRLEKFTGQIAREGIRGTRQTSRRMPKVKGTITAGKSIGERARQDISLTKAIAVNDWSGQGSILERDFFGSGGEQRDLLGDRNKDINLGGNVQKQFFGEKKNMNLISGTTGDVDLLGSKKKKDKEVRYY